MDPNNAHEQALEPILGCLLGTAIGDALGLPMEGLSPQIIARRFGDLSRYHLFGRTGRVSDDTEQSALVAQSLARARLSGGDLEAEAARHFRSAMRGWFWRLPFGIGLGTLRACLKLLIGMRRGIRSAGNGAAMRSAIVGVVLARDDALRRGVVRALAEVTHTDARAVDGALLAAEVAAHCTLHTGPSDRGDIVERALEVVRTTAVSAAVVRGRELAEAGADPLAAAAELGTTGFVVHSAGVVTFAFCRFGDDPLRCIRATIKMGGDTDTHAAMVGGWVGALHGVGALEGSLVDRLQGGPFGRKHLDNLASALAEGRAPPGYAWPWALVRNLLLYPVVLGHGFRRLLPF